MIRMREHELDKFIKVMNKAVDVVGSEPINENRRLCFWTVGWCWFWIVKLYFIDISIAAFVFSNSISIQICINQEKSIQLITSINIYLNNAKW